MITPSLAWRQEHCPMALFPEPIFYHPNSSTRGRPRGDGYEVSITVLAKQFDVTPAALLAVARSLGYSRKEPPPGTPYRFAVSMAKKIEAYYKESGK